MPRRVGPDDADVEVDRRRAHREDRGRVGEQHGDPAGTVVHPLRVHDVAARESEQVGDVGDDRVVDRPGAHQRGSGERQTVPGAPHPHQAGRALLDDRRGAFGEPPFSSQAWQVPSVGWPANGSSATG